MKNSSKQKVRLFLVIAILFVLSQTAVVYSLRSSSPIIWLNTGETLTGACIDGQGPTVIEYRANIVDIKCQ